jgi:HD-like signal output (HDOD) protein
MTAPSLVTEPRILFLDDEIAILSAMRSLFRKEGYDLILHSDPGAALEYLQNDPVDIIVSDLRMPHLSGIEFLSKAGSLCPGAIRIMLSGYEDKGVVLNAVARGLARDYVMKPWDDTTFRELIRDSVQLRASFHTQQLRDVFGSMESMPSPPHSLDLLARVLNGTDAPIKEIVAAIEQQPPLIARLLRVANSVHYGARHSIANVRDAVLFVGTEYVASLLLAMESFDALHACSGRTDGAIIERLWQEALDRARIAKAIAERWEGFEDRYLAFIASLFQEIGFVVRAQTHPDESREFFYRTEVQGTDILEADALTFGTTHDVVGSALLTYWNFPPPVVAAVTGHHQPPDDNPLMQILLIAENIERSSRNGFNGQTMDEATQRWMSQIDHVLPRREHQGAA